MARARKIPPSRYPAAVEVQYNAVLQKAVNEWFRWLRKRLIESPQLAAVMARYDAERQDNELDPLFEEAKAQWGRIANTIVPTLKTVSDRVNKVATLSTIAQIDAARKTIENQAVLSSAMRVSLREGFLRFGSIQGVIDQWTTDNVKLIKNIGDKAVLDVDMAVQNAVASGQRTKELVKILQEQQGYTKRRATLIARDQIGKLNGNIHRAQQKELGIKRYTWSATLDARTRPEHAKRDGQVFSWDNPPADGHPGQPIQCRCSSAPVFEPEFFGLTEAEIAAEAGERVNRERRRAEARARQSANVEADSKRRAEKSTARRKVTAARRKRLREKEKDAAAKAAAKAGNKTG